MLTNIAEFKMLAAENVGKCLQQLSKKIDTSQTTPFNGLINLQARLNRLNNSKLANVLSEDDEARQENQLVMDLLQFLDTLSDADFSPVSQLREEIYDKILVVCYGAGAVLELQPFFDSFYFKNVQYALYDFDDEQVAWADFIVFDYIYALDNDPDYYELLRQYLDETPGKYLLHFGRQDRLLDLYPMKVHTANTPFELYARIREMIEFKKFYKGKG